LLLGARNSQKRDKFSLSFSDRKVYKYPCPVVTMVRTTEEEYKRRMGKWYLDWKINWKNKDDVKIYRNIYNSDYRARNRSRLQSRRRVYYEKYKDKIRGQNELYRLEHQGEILQQRICKMTKKQRERYYQRKYKKTLRYKFHNLRRSAKTRKINFALTFQQFEKVHNPKNKVCVYCGISENELKNNLVHQTPIKVKRLTTDRKDNSKGYIFGNIVLACMRCNEIKNDIFTFKEMKEIGKTLRKKRMRLSDHKKN
jgi:hypothetical protein